MAIRTRMKYDDKGWPLSCRITVSNGRAPDGSQRRESITWHADPIAENTRKRREKSLNEAEAAFEAKVMNNKYLRGGNVFLKDYLADWLNDYVKRELTTGSYRTCETWTKNVIIPELGNVRLKDLTKKKLKDLYRKMEDGKLRNNPKKYQRGSIRRVHQTLSSALSMAVSDGLIEENVAKGIVIRRKEASDDVKHFDEYQVMAFLNSLEESYTFVNRGRPHKDGTPSAEHTFETKIQLQLKVLFYLALFGGLRRGELLALTWKDIDFHNCTVDINKSYEADRTKGKSKAPKTPGSSRIVKVPPECMSLLSDLQRERDELKEALGDQWKGDPDHDVIFIKADGSPMGIDTPNRAFRHAIQRYNQSHDEKLPEITLHGLRHTYATLLYDADMPGLAISKALGHSELSTTERIYVHAARRADARTAQILSDKLLRTRQETAPVTRKRRTVIKSRGGACTKTCTIIKKTVY